MTIDYADGRVFLFDEKWYLDAEPQVTILFERLFPGTRSIYSAYADEDFKKKFQYTQRPRYIPDTLSVRKDMYWFIQRFTLKMKKEDKQILMVGDKEYDIIQEESKRVFFEYKPVPLDFALPLRDYQEQAVALCLHKKNLLVADQVGLGKTPIGIAIGSKHLPAVVVVPPHLASQWVFEINKFLPKATVYRVRKGNASLLQENDAVPTADFYIISYHLLWKWAETFVGVIKPETIIFDEVHSLRSEETQKYSAATSICEVTNYRVGLSATPVMNYGGELFNIFDVLDPGSLGKREIFNREWCSEGKIRDPALLGNFLRKNMMMVRRTRKDVDMQMGPVNRVVYTVDADLHTLKKLEKEAKALAMTVITGSFHESGEAAREFDYRLRHATGVAKAKSVAETVKIILESGEKVVLFGWHRDVYDVWMKELESYYPVLYTGSESPKQKEESLKSFIQGNAKVFIISLRSGAGLNGLQDVSSYVVFGELDWSPGVIDQCIGRLWRDGQKEQVTCIFVTIDDGADPVMKKVIGAKATEAQQIMNPEAEVLASTGSDKVSGLAKEWLRSHGTDVDKLLDEKEKESKGDLLIGPPTQGNMVYDVYSALDRTVFNLGEEKVLQNEVESLFKKEAFPYDREVRLSKKSIVDFKVGNILIECKTNGFSKRDLLRQIKRYNKETDAEAIIAITPEPLRHFSIGKVPVYCVNISDKSLMIGGLQ